MHNVGSSDKAVLGYAVQKKQFKDDLNGSVFQKKVSSKIDYLGRGKASALS